MRRGGAPAGLPRRSAPPGPALAIAQLLRRFAEGIRSGTPLETDFGLAVRRHELFATLERMSDAGPITLST